jgi:hypothetical protein
VPANERDRAARLLLKALNTLSDRDRDLVLRNLLAGRVGLTIVEDRPEVFTSPGGSPGVGIGRQVEQPLLVRLPADLHRHFRQWATSHGFSMASVVRGLIERFLEQQEGGGVSKAPHP